jgi:hypothetical protein
LLFWHPVAGSFHLIRQPTAKPNVAEVYDKAFR